MLSYLELGPVDFQVVSKNHEKVGKVENINGFHQKNYEKVGKVRNKNDFDRKPFEKVGKVGNSNDYGRRAIDIPSICFQQLQ